MSYTEWNAYTKPHQQTKKKTTPTTSPSTKNKQNKTIKNTKKPTKKPTTNFKCRGNSTNWLGKAQTQNLNSWEVKVLSLRTQHQEITDSLFLKLQTVFLDTQDQRPSQSHSCWDMYADVHPSSHWSLCLWGVFCFLSVTLTNCTRIHCFSNKCFQIFYTSQLKSIKYIKIQENTIC